MARQAKGFSFDSIRKVLRIANEFKRDYMGRDLASVKMCISSGNRKIGRVMNVSLMPVMTCGNCKECKHFCYDIKACLQYPNTVIDARMRNTVLLLRNRDEYFHRIDVAISRRRVNKFFRWHVAGEIVDIDYFTRMCDIARKHSDFTFWTYTKMYDIVNAFIDANGRDAIPSNFHIMFSEWKGLPMNNPHDMPVFMCRFPDDPVPNAYRCPANCDVCKASGRGCIAGETTYNDLH